ncbi:hypothetical protein KJ684_00295 [Patescibacteria group bacterium]|nr:hypothetical protein [Patescibacteria group bacterium]
MEGKMKYSLYFLIKDSGEFIELQEIEDKKLEKNNVFLEYDIRKKSMQIFSNLNNLEKLNILSLNVKQIETINDLSTKLINNEIGVISRNGKIIVRIEDFCFQWSMFPVIMARRGSKVVPCFGSEVKKRFKNWKNWLDRDIEIIDEKERHIFIKLVKKQGGFLGVEVGGSFNVLNVCCAVYIAALKKILGR